MKTKWLLLTKVYFPKLDELVEKLLAKCVACKVVTQKAPTSNFKHYVNTKRSWTPVRLISWNRYKFHQFPILNFIISHQFTIKGSQSMDLGIF